MSKVAPEHLSRSAFIYVRQSTPDQLVKNLESRRRQYALTDRARALGWEDAIVIDDDLGRSASGIARSGFERLLSAVCVGTAGAVFAIEASRLARNGRDWHTLLEYCGLMNCLIIDEDAIYDPKLINDRLLLGMKGTFSELELSLFRQRSHEALRLKAARGELHSSVAVGYVRSFDDRLELDPDERVRTAVSVAFKKFAEIGSVRQVAMWLGDEGIDMPVVVYGPRGRIVEWRQPRYNAIHRLLTNPVYAGAYAFGRTGSRIRLEAGRKVISRGVRRAPDSWQVLIREHHDGYISWDQYERNQRTISGNANMKGEMVPGSVRKGDGLLAGILRCGHCGRKLKVEYKRGFVRYLCNDTNIKHARRTKCIAVGNMRIDTAVSVEILRVIAPLGLDAAVQAIADREHAGTERLRQIELALEQARYEAARAHRQYDVVEPENRLASGDLERRWNARLADVARLEGELGVAREKLPPAITEAERAQILALGADLRQLWSHPAASATTRKRILRAVLEEIVITVEPTRLQLKLHWKGGDHTALDVEKNRPRQLRWTSDVSTEQLIRDLSRLMPDRSIASVLNRLGVRSAMGLAWTQQRIRTFRSDHGIAVHREGERAERGEVVLQEAASRLRVSKMTVIRLIKDGLLPAKQICVGAPYVIRETDLDLPVVRHAIANGRAVSQDPRQESLKYQ